MYSIFMISKKELGERIRKLRRDKNLSMLALAKKLDCHTSLINHYEKGGKNIPLEMAFKLEDALENDAREISAAVILMAYFGATGKEDYQPGVKDYKPLPKHRPGPEKVATSSVHSDSKLIELGEIAGKKVRLRLELE